ncbi:helix-turn-helix domain-containing protein [Enterobacteriaceae bacterium LUAb1]
MGVEMNMDELIGQELKRLRVERTSVKEMGMYLDLSQQHISNIERGKVKIKMSIFIKWCEILEIDSAEVLSRIIRKNKDINFF